MRIPVPDDWHDDAWRCVQISWPDSPKWMALLVGFMSQAQRGRYWDERSGNIKDAQGVGQEIFRRNFPFTLCEDGEKIIIDTEIVHMFIGGDCEESEDEMSACGYNPKAFKIEDGSLYVRDFCGDWVKIGVMADQPDLPPETELPDPPIEGYQDATACSMAAKLAVMAYNVVVESFAQVSGVEYIDIWDYYNDMNDAFGGIDLSFNDLMNMWASTGVLDVAGLEGETKDAEAIEWLKCYWSDIITPNNAGITEADYQACIDSTEAALRNLWPKGLYEGFDTEMIHLWRRAVSSLGPKDAQKVTYYAQPTPGQSCSCPGGDGPTPPTANGWYMSRVVSKTEVAGAAYNTKMCHKVLAEHDVYGCVFTVEWTQTKNIKRMGASSASCSGYDLDAWGDTSDHLEWEAQGHKWGCGELPVLDELLGVGEFTQKSCSYDSQVVATPGALAGNIINHGYFMDDADEGQSFTIHLRYIYNTGSPSHL